MKRLLLAALIGAGCGTALAITPPVITSPAPGVVHFSWSAPATRANGAALTPAEIGGYKLYLTNEPAAITVPGNASAYDYVVPAGYTTKSSDAAAISAFDTTGTEGPASAAVSLPVGISTPKPLISAPGSFKVQ